jgi:hypothetical protein
MNKTVGRGVLTLLTFGLLQIPHVAAAQSEGIKVHGRWTIDVRQPDGTLVSHREFENALLVSREGSTVGNVILARILGRELSLGNWHIYLGSDNQSDPAPCINSAMAPAIVDGFFGGNGPGRLQNVCMISEVGSSISSSQIGTLTVSVVGAQLVLTGTATASKTGKIREVVTLLGADSSSYYPSPISGTVLREVIEVVKDQIIQVKVAISFQ